MKSGICIILIIIICALTLQSCNIHPICAVYASAEIETTLSPKPLNQTESFPLLSTQ